MKKLFYLVIIFGLMACESPVIQRVEEAYPGEEPKKICYYQEQNGYEIKIEEQQFYQNGDIKMSGKFVNGKREGVWNAYFQNKQIQSSGTFKDGLRIGEAKVYFPNGQLRYKGFYDKNKKTGHWNFYTEEGKLSQEKEY